MKDSKTILLGIKRFCSKDGKEYAILQLRDEFTERETQAGSVGFKVQEQFVPAELLIKLDSLKIGKPIAFDYNIVGSRAYVSDFYSLDK